MYFSAWLSESRFFIGEGIMSRQFGQHLKELRTSRTDLSQAEIARLLYIDRSTYTNHELGKTEPPIDTIKKLAKLLGVSVNRLLDYDDYPDID